MADATRWCMVAKTVLAPIGSQVTWPANAWIKPTVEIVARRDEYGFKNSHARFTWWELVKCDD